MKENLKITDPWLALKYPADKHPVIDEIKARRLQLGTIDWCRKFFKNEIANLEEALSRLDTGLFAVLVYPGAKEEAACFLSDFMAWWFLLDDRLESSHDDEEDSKKRRALFRSYITSLCGSNAIGEIEDAFVLSARDLGRRLPQFARPELCKRFCDAMENWLFEGIEKELAICGDPSKTCTESYFQIRPFSSGVLPTLYLGELASAPMPLEALQSELIKDFLNEAGEIIYLGNDIFSYRKEVKRPCNFNLAIILKKDLAFNEMEALKECARLHNKAVDQYKSLKARLGETVPGPWLESIDNVLAGLIAWQMSAKRYQTGECFWYWI